MDKPEFCLAEEAAALLGGAELLECDVRSDADMARAVELGFPAVTLLALAEHGVTDREIAKLIINARTLAHRRAKGQKLTVEESDRAARVARTVALAERTFANRDKASRWLHKKLRTLDDLRPIDLIRTNAGARLVEDALMGIAWGAPG